MSEQGQRLVNLFSLEEQIRADGQKLRLTERDIKEIQHSLFYAERLAHGTAGHNQIMLIASLARFLGFQIDVYGELHFPDDVRIVKLEPGVRSE
jgi:hypothetical protein